MSTLERELRDLAPYVFPPTPDLVPGVRARLAAPRRPQRRWLLVAVAALALAGSAAAAPLVLDWLGIRGARVTRANELPPVRAQLEPPFFGEPVTLETARRTTSFPVRVPEELGEPDAVYVRDDVAGGMVTLVWGEGPRYRAALSTWYGRSTELTIDKVVGPGTTAERLGVGSGRGVWIEGRPHTVSFVGIDGEYRLEQVHLAGNVLLWERGPLSLRLEADVSRAEALAIARSLR